MPGMAAGETINPTLVRYLQSTAKPLDTLSSGY